MHACLDSRACMNDTQTMLHMTKAQRLLCSTSGTRAGANRPFSSAMSLVSEPGALVTSGYVSGLVLPPLKHLNSAKQTDETLVTLCLPNFKSHTYSP